MGIGKGELPNTLKQIFRENCIYDRNGNKQNVSGGISENEAILLQKILIDINAATTLETGVAYGVSTMVFCACLKELNNKNAIHYGVDPNQSKEFKGAAVNSLKKEDLSKWFKLLEGPSHLMLPKLIEEGIKLDCALIDGWHTFDYTLLDFFYIDKLLKPKGLVLLHDMYGRNKQKVLAFILTHRDYKIETKYLVKSDESKIRIAKFFLWRIFKDPALIWSKYHWKYQTRSTSGLLVLKKISNYEPTFDFFKNF